MREIEDHVALRHPFLERFARGVNLHQIRKFASQHYAYSRMFIRNLASVLSNTPDENARRLLAMNIYEEIGGPLRSRDHAHLLLLNAGLVSGEQLAEAAADAEARGQGYDIVSSLIAKRVVTREQVSDLVEREESTGELTHTALFRRFMRAVDLGPDSLDAPLEQTEEFIRVVATVTRERSWLTGLGALGPGTECIVPRLYSAILTGLERSQLVKQSDCIFWTIHVHCDEGHGRNIIEAMLPHATSDATCEEIRAGAMIVLAARSRWMETLARHVFD